MLEMEVICKEVTNVLKFFLSSQMGNKSHKFNDQPLLSPLKRTSAWNKMEKMNGMSGLVRIRLYFHQRYVVIELIEKCSSFNKLLRHK